MGLQHNNSDNCIRRGRRFAKRHGITWLLLPCFVAVHSFVRDMRRSLQHNVQQHPSGQRGTRTAAIDVVKQKEVHRPFAVLPAAVQPIVRYWNSLLHPARHDEDTHPPLKVLETSFVHVETNPEVSTTWTPLSSSTQQKNRRLLRNAEGDQRAGGEHIMLASTPSIAQQHNNNGQPHHMELLESIVQGHNNNQHEWN